MVNRVITNRGGIKNESPKSVTGGFIATMDTSIISNAIRRDTLIKALNFEKMKFASILQESSC